MADQPRKIGEMNGRWAMLFKFVLVMNGVLIPALLAWGSWVTVGQIKDETFRSKGDRYTPEHAAHDLTSLRTEIAAEQLALHQEGRMETRSLMQAQDEILRSKLEAMADKLNVVLMSLTELRAEMRARDQRRSRVDE
jgi:hypothetical protein